jgi:hypothetical protein
MRTFSLRSLHEIVLREQSKEYIVVGICSTQRYNEKNVNNFSCTMWIGETTGALTRIWDLLSL